MQGSQPSLQRRGLRHRLWGRFRIAKALGFGQGVGELRTGGVHLVKDEVGGAVNDAQDAGDAVADRLSRIGRRMGIAPATAAS